MRRRDLIAGVGSLGLLAGGGVLASSGLPSFDDADDSNEDDGSSDDPVTIETIDAPGSEAGEIRVPSRERATFVDFFATWCDPCIEQMPALAEASDRIGDEVLFVSVTSESVGDSLTEDELVDWWDEHDGDWTVGVDPKAELTSRYMSGGYPFAAAFDASGRVRWSDSGVKSADDLVEGIERALEAESDGGSGSNA
ncbi:TlpA family protein disulfide reductase [Natrialbaceae archaeon GCM10025810]|uniref:TlpA family protein disulfide reductase n=1 Tax=Halovalidus salilacus TaxID=3075124 RepID=UPI003611AEA2